MAVQRIRVLAGSGTVDVDGRFTSMAIATVTGDLTLNITGLDPNGGRIAFLLTQDGSGGHTLTITALSGGANVTVGASTFNTTAGATTNVAVTNIEGVLYVEYDGAGGSASSVAWSNVTGTPTTLTGYGITDAINTSEKGVANGVAELGANTQIPPAQMGGVSGTSSNFLRGDGNWESVSFGNLVSTPTTLSGYEISDAINVSEKGAANGVATLGANSLVPTAQLGTGTADATTYVRGDQTYAVPA